MKNFTRKNPLFALCGLNCALCSMHFGGYCPGCGGGDGNQSCAIAKCSLTHGVEYCSQCGEYPCKNFDKFDSYDSFITHRSRHKDLLCAKTMGYENYLLELNEKSAILNELLQNYNAGRQKTFYSVAVNLLDLADLKTVMEQIENTEQSDGRTPKEKAAIAVGYFQKMAAAHNIELKLHKKP